MIRAFLAIWPGPEIVRLHAAVHAACRRQFPGLRWVAPENLHLTLKFLGDAEERVLRLLEERVREVLDSLCPFCLRLGAPGSFGAARQPRTLWLGLAAGADAAAELAARIAAAATGLGFPRESRPWSPHLTVARNPRGVEAAGWEEVFRKSDLPGSAWNVENVALVASRLNARGPVYSTLCSLPVGRSATPNSNNVS